MSGTTFLRLGPFLSKSNFSNVILRNKLDRTDKLRAKIETRAKTTRGTGEIRLFECQPLFFGVAFICFCCLRVCLLLCLFLNNQ